ncbi:hypothetical protein HYU18_02905 [Candidatus Woesearchaeota archaeon]|nr:hypothetical protein [Candidatus Woesearchaeota archaeon]
MGFRKQKEAERGSPENTLSYQVYSPSPSDEPLKQLASQLAQKNTDIDRLRRYITQLEEGEKGIVQELTRQLASKDDEISRVAALYSKKEAENKKLSDAFEAHIVSERDNAEKIKQLLLRKEQQNSATIDKLGAELAKKDLEISSLRNALVEKKATLPRQLPEENLTQKAELHEKDRLIGHLGKLLEEEQQLSRATQQKLSKQISEMAWQISQLKGFVAEKEKIIQSLESTTETSLTTRDAEIKRLREATEKNREMPQPQSAETSPHHEKLISRLRHESTAKDEEISALREQLVQKNFREQRESPHGKHLEELDRLRSELEEKEHRIGRLERDLNEEQKLAGHSQARLKEQVSEMAKQTEELKAFLIEKERLLQNLETAFEKRLAAKEEELRRLKEAVHKKPELHFRGDVDKLQSELQVKEQASKMMAEEIAKLKEQSGLLRKRLEERQRLFFESEKAYEELIAKLREQHDTRLRSLVQDSSQKEAALRTAIEEERIKLQQERALIREKEHQIEETLQAFNATSQKLIRLGSPAETGSQDELALLQQQLDESKKALEEKKAYIESKETELKQLLSTTEEKIAELKAKEATIDRKEQLLLQEQQALNRELEVLSNAGIEISKSKDYIKQKLEQVGTQEAYAPSPQPIQKYPQQSQQKTAPIPQPKMASADFGLATGEVQEAQEEEGFENQKFTGATSPQSTVQEAASAAIEEGVREDLFPAKTAPAPKPQIKPIMAAKPAKLTKTQQKKLAQKLKAEAKTARLQQLKLKKQAATALKQQQKIAAQQLKQKPSQPMQKPLPITTSQPKEMAIGARESENHSPDQELFSEMGGYSETDEIKSIVEVGLSHGDSVEQIRDSLLTSGYSKANIEKVLSNAKK